ncbi:MAG TPA: hypothetical protein VK209_07605 [Candidatus Sulfotelmatobacter sp.]|nr:hypothetical protein [Candidatus Sulfotelmatobacter sp.]
MQRISAKIITALLLGALSLTLVPLAFASTDILINDETAPQDTITPVPAGGNLDLNFNGVTFSGSQFYLVLSQDGLFQRSVGDVQYTPLFDRLAVFTPANTTVSGTVAFPGSWLCGFGWVYGPIPLNIAGGTYYIKAFDNETTPTAVTQGFTVAASLRIIPTTGIAGTPIIISGSTFPANALVNLTYDSTQTGLVSLANNIQTDVLGQFNYTMPAPDLKQAATIGDNTVVTDDIEFNATADGTTVYYANYTESRRGLIQLGRPDTSGVAGNLQNATVGIYGNETDFTSTISVDIGNTFRIIGNNFYPGVVTMKWDNTIDLAPTGNTADAAGYFNATFSVPATGFGKHSITLIDAGLQVFAVYVNVVPSITITPDSGPTGTTVTVNGFGFPASVGGDVYNAAVTFQGATGDIAGALTDANGQFSLTFTVPTGSTGGVHLVAATANMSGFTPVAGSFTVLSAFTVSPTSFYANSSAAVVATATGFLPESTYIVTIDNVFSPFSSIYVEADSSGTIALTFMQAGFQPGVHVVALYEMYGDNTPVANATFTVLSPVAVQQNAMLTAINATVTAINNNLATLSDGTTVLLNAINASLAGVSNGLAVVNTNVGTLTTSWSSINGTLSSVSGTIGTVSTTIGSIQTNLSSIGTTVTKLDGNVATVQTDVGTIKGTVTETNGKVATIQTDIGTLQADVSSVDTSVKDVPSQVNVPIWIAVVLALVAAIAAIASLLLVRRKIAG